MTISTFLGHFFEKFRLNENHYLTKKIPKLGSLLKKIALRVFFFTIFPIQRCYFENSTKIAVFEYKWTKRRFSMKFSKNLPLTRLTFFVANLPLTRVAKRPLGLNRYQIQIVSDPPPFSTLPGPINCVIMNRHWP